MFTVSDVGQGWEPFEDLDQLHTRFVKSSTRSGLLAAAGALGVMRINTYGCLLAEKCMCIVESQFACMRDADST